jgi:hypothetical protein
MKKLIIFVTLLMILFLAWRAAFPAFAAQVRLTITVDDNGTLKAASSVVQIAETTYPTFGGIFGSGFEDGIHGETAFLDLGEGRNLVPLLGPGSWAWINFQTKWLFFPYSPNDKDYGSLAFARRMVATNLGKPRLLDVKAMPEFVTFRDRMNPKTIEKVDPLNLEASFGPGVRLVSVSLEITNDPFTKGIIVRQLPWLPAMIERLRPLTPHFDPKNPLADDIFRGNFARE